MPLLAGCGHHSYKVGHLLVIDFTLAAKVEVLFLHGSFFVYLPVRRESRHSKP